VARVFNAIDTTAWLLPNYDPSWFGPGTLILATLEIDIASICASVPIFWPVLSTKILKIFVVTQVTVETRHRPSVTDDSDHDAIPMGPVVSQEALMHKKGLESMFTPNDYERGDGPFMGHVDPRRDMFGASVYIRAADNPVRRQ
jgi:hypothetical protein